MTTIRRTKIKALFSGRSATISFFEKDIFYGLASDRRKKTKKETQPKTHQEKIETRKRSSNRAKKIIFNLISTNAWFWYKENNLAYLPVFLTLTHKENMTDIKHSNIFHTRFIKNLNYHIFHTNKVKLRYLSVLEFQKRGAVHYHIVFFNVPHILKKVYSDIWGQGFVHIRTVDENQNVAGYLVKYLSKGNKDLRLQNKKRYSCSRGLLKPVAINNQEDALALYQKIPKEYITGKNIFNHEYLGTMTTFSYDFGKGKTVSDIIGESI